MKNYIFVIEGQSNFILTINIEEISFEEYY